MENEDDARLVENILCEVKSQGIFDQFRRQCMADVDIKPAYQNLRQRVESSVSKFLKDQEWKSDLNKNQLREKLRKYITDSGFLETGVERIVDQVVNPKINSIFLPKIEDIFYKYIGVDKPKNSEIKLLDNGGSNICEPLDVDIKSTFLPNDLEAVSPDSDKSGQKSLNDSSGNLNSSNNSIKNELNDSSEKVEDFESPAFELIEGRISSTALSKGDDEDSKLSGISGLTSQDSIESCEDNNQGGDSTMVQVNETASTMQQMINESHNQDSVLSQVSSGSRLSIVTNESHKSRGVDLCEEAQMPKFNENSTESNKNMEIESSEKLSFDIKKDQIKFEGTDRRSSLTDIKREYKPMDVDEVMPRDFETNNSMSMTASAEAIIKIESSSSNIEPITIKTENLTLKDECKSDIDIEMKSEEFRDQESIPQTPEMAGILGMSTPPTLPLEMPLQTEIQSSTLIGEVPPLPTNTTPFPIGNSTPDPFKLTSSISPLLPILMSRPPLPPPISPPPLPPSVSPPPLPPGPVLSPPPLPPSPRYISTPYKSPSGVYLPPPPGVSPPLSPHDVPPLPTVEVAPLSPNKAPPLPLEPAFQPPPPAIPSPAPPQPSLSQSPTPTPIPLSTESIDGNIQSNDIKPDENSSELCISKNDIVLKEEEIVIDKSAEQIGLKSEISPKYESEKLKVMSESNDKEITKTTEEYKKDKDRSKSSSSSSSKHGNSANDSDRKDHKSHKKEKYRERDRSDRDRDRSYRDSDRHSSLSSNRDKYKEKKHSSYRHSSSSNTSMKSSKNEKDEIKSTKTSSDHKRDDSKSRSESHRSSSSSSTHRQSNSNSDIAQNGNQHDDKRHKSNFDRSKDKDKDKQKRDESTHKIKSNRSSKSDEKSKKRTEESDSKSNKKSSKSQNDDDHSVFHDKHTERRRSTDRDSNDGHSSGFTSKNSSTTNRNESNSISSSSKGSTSSSPTSTSTSSSATDTRTTQNTIMAEQVLVAPMPLTNDIKAMLKESLSIVNPETENEDDFMLPTLPVVVDQILTGKDISLEFLMAQSSIDSIDDPVISTIQQSLNNSGVKIKKPKIASNMNEARKLMKIRKQMERDQKKQIEKALVIAKQYINKNIGFGIDKQGVELQFACSGSDIGPHISSPIKNRSTLDETLRKLSPKSQLLKEQMLKEINESVQSIQPMRTTSVSPPKMPSPSAKSPRKSPSKSPTQQPISPKRIEKMSPKSNVGECSPKLSDKGISGKSSPGRSSTKSESSNRKTQQKSALKKEKISKSSSPLTTKRKKLHSHSDDNEDFLGFPLKRPKYELNVAFIKFAEQLDKECCDNFQNKAAYSDTAYLYNVEDAYKLLFKSTVSNIYELNDDGPSVIVKGENLRTPARRWSEIEKIVENEMATMKALHQLKTLNQSCSTSKIGTSSTPTPPPSSTSSPPFSQSPARKNGAAVKKSFEMQLAEASFIQKNGKTNRTAQKRKVADLKEMPASKSDECLIQSAVDDGYNNNQLVKRPKIISQDDSPGNVVSGIDSETKASPTPSEKSIGSKENKFTQKLTNPTVHISSKDQISDGTVSPVINKKELVMTSVKKSMNSFKDSQRYTSEDLYKPRPILIGSRSRRRPLEN